LGCSTPAATLVDDQRDMSTEATALPSTLNIWSYEDQQFEVNQFHDGEGGAWCYESYGVNPDSPRTTT
jgi:hypothetical protein